MFVFSRSVNNQRNVLKQIRSFSTQETVQGNKKPGFSFEVVYKSRKSNARVGVIRTPHGDIHTPSFVPVATNASLKHVDHRVLLDEGLQLIFCNTFHLLVHPGTEVIKSAGGLHKFMNYPRPIITDSGGFQVFSLLDPQKNKDNDELKGKNKKAYPGLIVKIREEGVTFKSYRNGDTIFLSPETSVEAQKAFGADIIVPLDELIAYNVSPKHLLRAFDRTHRWEKRSLDAHLANRNGQAMYSVLHGGPDKELRKQSIEILSSLDFDGHAIGKDKREMVELLTYMMPMLSPQKKPIHLLGIGDITSIDLSVPLGIDTFDSAYPSRTARHGLLTTSRGPISIDSASFKNKHEPIDPECTCHTCKHFTAAYLYHLYKTNEVAGLSYGTLHNLHFLTKKFEKIREKILRDEI